MSGLAMPLIYCAWRSQCTPDKSNISRDFLPSNASVSLSYLLLLNAHAPSLPLSLPPSPDYSGQQHQWSDVHSGARYCCQDKMWLFYYAVIRARAKTLRSQRPWAKEVFIEARRTVRGYDPSWRIVLEGETRKTPSSTSTLSISPSSLSPRNRKEWTWPLHMCSPGLPRQH